MRPIVLIELNEVPNNVLDDYAQRSRFIAEWLGASERYTTVAADRIQLDPWIAWPSFHRGVNDEQHGLLHLGQSTSSADQFPPVWRLLQQHHIDVGVYGSLFSNAETDIAPYAFFVPDAFSPHCRVKPAELSAFQKFNLRMTRASGRNADEAISSGGGMAMAKLALSGWIRPTTLSRVARQLITERLDRKRLSRRRNIQTELHADVFTSLLAKTRPQFATFYTNNVAAAMHRFWAASLPRTSISRERLTSQWLNDYSNEVAEALYSVERLLRLLETGRCGDVTVVIASAIGQEEIVAENHHCFLSIISPERFANRVMDVGLDQFELCPTMVPDFTFRFRRSDTAEASYARLATVEIDGVRPIETQERMHSKMLMASASRLAHIRHAYGDGHFKHPFTYSRSDDRTIHVSLQVDDYKGEPKVSVADEVFSFEELGIGLVAHDERVNCTAQHCAEGSLIVHRAGATPTAGESPRISSLDFVPSLLEYFGISSPSYLQGQPLVKL